MKKNRLTAAALSLMMLTGCGGTIEVKPDGQTIEVNIEQTEPEQTAAPETTTPESKPEYDIETVFPDELFVQIIEGEATPVEVTYGQGGEQGYLSYSSQDPAMIADFIAGFRAIQIDQIITDPENMGYTADGIDDFSFIMDDGSSVLVSLDCTTRAHENDVVYELTGTAGLNEARMKIQQTTGVPEIPAPLPD